MATKIQLTTELLRSQEATMRRLYEEQQSYNTRITSAINKMNDGLTNALRHNISSKANTVISQASSTAETLNWGADAIVKVIAAYEGVEGTLKNLIEKFFEVITPNGNGSTDNNELMPSSFQQKVDEMKKSDGFRQGDPWGWNDHYKGKYKGYDIDAWSCCAKAKQMQIEVTGKLGTYTGITDISQIKEGDVLHYCKPGGCETPGVGKKECEECGKQHWVFVISKLGDKLSIGEGNAYDAETGKKEVVNYGELDLSIFSNGYTMMSIYR